jgi:hypothetical protein
MGGKGMKYIWTLLLCVVMVGIGYSWRMYQDSDTRYSAWLNGQQYILNVINQESAKGYDFSIVIADTRVEFKPIKNNEIVRVLQ